MYNTPNESPCLGTGKGREGGKQRRLLRLYCVSTFSSGIYSAAPYYGGAILRVRDITGRIIMGKKWIYP